MVGVAGIEVEALKRQGGCVDTPGGAQGTEDLNLEGGFYENSV